LDARLAKASVSRIVIERTLKLVTITVCTARPGVIIGKGGSEVDKLKEELKKITDKEIQINIFEVKRPELDATIVANNIARQLEGKMAYRRAIKTAIASTMRMGAEGIKVQISGRLNGAEMARSEMYKEGRTPLHTLRADIDYALGEALTKVGLLGIKVWICRGEVYGKRDLSPQFAGLKETGHGGGSGSGDNRGGGRGDRNDRDRGPRDRGERNDRGDRGGDRRNNNNRNRGPRDRK
jgi:small subunit ribosomal protein S3